MPHVRKTGNGILNMLCNVINCPPGLEPSVSFYTSALSSFDYTKGRHQTSLSVTTTFSQKFTEPTEGISYPVVDPF